MSYLIRTYECLDCRLEAEYVVDEKGPENCKRCNSVQLELRFGRPALHFFRKGIYENIGPDPIEISSMDQLKRECDKHGVTSHYERDTSHGTKPKRWF